MSIDRCQMRSVGAGICRGVAGGSGGSSLVGWGMGVKGTTGGGDTTGDRRGGIDVVMGIGEIPLDEADLGVDLRKDHGNRHLLAGVKLWDCRSLELVLEDRRKKLTILRGL